MKNEEYYACEDKTMEDAVEKVHHLLDEKGMIMFCVVAAVMDPHKDGFKVVTVGHFGDKEGVPDPNGGEGLQLSEAVGQELMSRGVGMIELNGNLRTMFGLGKTNEKD